MFGMHAQNHIKIGKGVVCIDTINNLIAEGRVIVTIPDVDRIPTHHRDFFSADKTYPVDCFEVRQDDQCDGGKRLIVRVEGDTGILEHFDNDNGGIKVFTEDDFENIRSDFEKTREKELADQRQKNQETLLECLGNLLDNPEDLKPGDIVMYRKDILTEQGKLGINGDPIVVVKTSFHPKEVAYPANLHEDPVSRFVVCVFHDSHGNLSFQEIAAFDLTKIGRVPEAMGDKLEDFARNNIK